MNYSYPVWTRVEPSLLHVQKTKGLLSCSGELSQWVMVGRWELPAQSWLVAGMCLGLEVRTQLFVAAKFQ